MRSVSIALATCLLTLCLSTTCQADWGCYDPQPGHPTVSERTSFLQELRPIAQQLDDEFGVPRAGILATAVKENGYGWTRLAINARNILSWKVKNGTKEHAWVLECQPSSNKGHTYMTFSDSGASMRYVRHQLATSKRYFAATTKAAGCSERRASEEVRTYHWLAGIQKAGYNPRPTYPDEVMQAGRDAGVFSGWGEKRSRSDSPEKLPPSQKDIDYAMRLMRGRGAYMVNSKCVPEDLDKWLDYRGVKDGVLKRCTYVQEPCSHVVREDRDHCNKQHPTTLSGTVVLLEPGIEVFARWIAFACAKAGGDREMCMRKLFCDGNYASGWQIPVSGIVFEPMDHRPTEGYAFRDGLTVRADAQCGWQNGWIRSESQQEEVDCARPSAVPREVSNQARPLCGRSGAELSRLTGYAKVVPSHAEAYPIAGEQAGKWRLFVREVLISSASSDENPMVTARAIALRSQNEF